ncbi:MAG TPA: glycosyltransferase family 4 protein [Bryobacteraceae bacterium]|nr:glycosyltransferase family 4 protein [Bryobacteraceae bacterium]
MRILLAHNSLYYPSYGGGDKSNRLLMEALAARGHSVRVAGRVEHFGGEAHAALLRDLGERGIAANPVAGFGVEFPLNGVDVRILTREPRLRAYFAGQVREFDPDVIITSTDDPAHLMLDVALRAPRARVVYLVRATIALPFGPDSGLPSAFHTEALRHADGVVAVSEYVAEYTRRWGGVEAIHVPISLLDSGSDREYPKLGRFDNRYVSMVNPCAVKGIAIFLALAERFPNAAFATVPTWGTTAADFAELRRRPNVAVLPPVDDIDDLLRQTRVMLAPSLWAEARSRVILEAMSRGIPVMASKVGGLAEAMLGVDYLLPVAPVTRYRPMVDELMVPMVEVPPQDVTPWATVLERLLTDRAHYEEVAARARQAALAYAGHLTAGPFEAYLGKIAACPKRDPPPQATGRALLSDERRRLLALRLRRAGATAADASPAPSRSD